MKFRRDNLDDELEINLVPLIDVLLVILIFLAATTSFARFQQMNVSLPQADSHAPAAQAPLFMAISHDGHYALNDDLLPDSSAQGLAQALIGQGMDPADAVLVIHADARTPHEAVIRAMDAAQLAGLRRIHFATQGAP
ncbi:MAG: biopolymer transporter ExbD [Candidimonas sp.]|jgi:biopolymer transport protein ExbD